MGRSISSKIKSQKNLRTIVSRLTRSGKRVVFTNGCFDLVHAGHVRLFQRARSLGDVLIVAINSDASLRRLKGPQRPLVPQKNRTEVLAALASVDYVTVFNEDTPAEIIRKLKPHTLIKGGDYTLKNIIGRTVVKRVVRFPVQKGFSTTALIHKIVKAYGTKKRSF